MSMLRRGRLLVPLLALLYGQGQAADRPIYFTAVPPSQPALTADVQRTLAIGSATLTVDDATAAVIDATGGWLQGRLQAVWKTNAAGVTLDRNGLPTSDPAAFVLDHYVVDYLIVSLRGDDGVVSTREVLGGATGPLTGTIPFTAAPEAKAGEIYWYDGSSVDVADVVNGTRFLSPADAQRFSRQQLQLPAFNLYRAQTNRWSDGSTPADFGIEHTPTRVLARNAYTGGRFAVVVAATHQGYVFHGVDCLVDGVANPDPYLLEGVTAVFPNAITQGDGSIGWLVTQLGNDQHAYTATVAQAVPDSEVPEPYHTQWMAFSGNTATDLSVTSAPANRTTVEGQDVQDLHDQVVLARTGVPDDQAQITQVKESLQNGEYLHVAGDGTVTTTDAANYADGGLEDLRSAVATGALNSVALDLQAQPNLAEQVAPVIQDPPTADTLALHEAVSTVDAEIYAQTASNLPLGGKLPHRYAEMNPGGWLPSYLEGNPSPGDGTNPVDPHPSGVTTGAPAYDLNGDGSLDRFYTDDPYSNGFDQVVIKWDVDSRLMQLGDYPANHDKCTFAVFGQNHAQPEQRKLLFCGFDGTMWREKKITFKGGKFGVTQYSFALKSLLEPTGTANTYHFGLRYIGAAPLVLGAPVPPTPMTSTVTWTSTVHSSLPDGSPGPDTTVIGSETVYLYNDVADESELLSASFSDPAFTPHATTGRPVMAAQYVTTLTNTSGGAPTTTTTYFPADFTPDKISVDPEPAVPRYDNAFMWNFATLGDGYPWNYVRGSHFPTGLAAVALNTPAIVAKYGGTFPLQPADAIVEAGGVDILVKEAPDAPVGLAPDSGSPLDPATQANAQIWANWTNLRSMWHTPWDFRTDMNGGGDPTANHHHGERTYDLVEGAGYYLFKGKWVPVSSGDAQRSLLRQMWEWDMYQPKTVYTQLHFDNDPTKPLLNTVRAPLAATTTELNNPTTGILNQDLHATGGTNLNQNAQRRSDLMQKFWFIFSAAKGREHEIDMALHTPKNTHLVCVEWDDFDAVQKQFGTYDIEFTSTDEQERKLKGNIITSVYGKTNLQARTGADGTPLTTVTGDAGIVALETDNPGSYIFTNDDLLYDKPCNYLQTCALLDDEQYGDPRPDEWVSAHKMQFRHPMALFYDDRWSVEVAAYGHNADPRIWCAKWDLYSAPNADAGSDACRIAFEGWITDARLSDLYDRMHHSDFLTAKAGDLLMPNRPAVVAQPVAPVAPPDWTDGPVVFPTAVPDPGPRPTAPINAVWSDTRPDWMTDPETGGRGGASLGDVTTLPDWALTFPMTLDLVQAHDAWLAQFPNTSTITAVAPQTTVGGTTVHFSPTFTPASSSNITSFTLTTAPHTVYTISPPLNRAAIVISHPVVVTGTDSTGATIAITVTRTSVSGFTYTGLAGGTPNFGVDPAGGWAYVLGDHLLNMGVPTVGTYPEIAFPPGKYFWNIFVATHGASINFTLSSPTNVNVIAFSFDDTQVFLDGTRIDDFGGDHFGAPIDRTYPRLLAAGPHSCSVTTDGNGSGYGARGIMVRIPSLASNAQAIADADLAIWQAYRTADNEWNDKHIAYTAYLDAETVAEAKQALYDQWLADRPARLQAYADDLAAYTVAQAAYAAYVIQEAAWQATYDANRDAIEMWQRYVSGRSAWVYLVTARAGEPGVAWTLTEPIGDAFTFWRSQPECTCE